MCPLWWGSRKANMVSSSYIPSSIKHAPPPSSVQLETRISCPLTKMQTFWYRRLLLRDSSVFAAEEAKAAAEAAGEPAAAAVRGRPKGGVKAEEGATGRGPAAEPSGAEAGPSGSAAAAGSEAGAVAKVGGAESYKRLMNLLMQLRKV